jgi:hypothetical protein
MIGSDPSDRFYLNSGGIDDERERRMVFDGVNGALDKLKNLENDYAGALQLLHYAGRMSRNLSDARVNNAFAEDEAGNAAYTASLRQSDLFLVWQRLARDGSAIALFHFEKTITETANAAASCLTIAHLVDKQKIEAVRHGLLQFFPNLRDVRNAICHAAEASFESTTDKNGRPKKESKRQRHALKNAKGKYLGGLVDLGDDADATLFMSGMAAGKQSTYTQEGRVVSIELSEEGFAKLIELRRQIYRTLEAAAKHLTDLGTEKAKRASQG